MMMAHAPLMAAALASAGASLLLRATGLPWRQAAALAGVVVAGLALERLVAGVRAAIRHRDPAGLLFVPLHLLATPLPGPRHRRLGRPPPGRPRPPPSQSMEALNKSVRFEDRRSSAAGPVRDVSICPRVTFACPPCGQMESAPATHVAERQLGVAVFQLEETPRFGVAEWRVGTGGGRAVRSRP